MATAEDWPSSRKRDNSPSESNSRLSAFGGSLAPALPLVNEGSLPKPPDESISFAASTLQLPSQNLQEDYLPNTPPNFTPNDNLPGEMESAGPAAELPASPQRSIRPRFNFGGEWLGETDNIEFMSFTAGVKIPSYPVFGPPPPIFNLGTTYLDLNAPAELELPGELYDHSFGLAWMRPINPSWMLRLMLNVGIATDGENMSGDAWQFRGGAFALYRHNPAWSWAFGVLALGRNDLPAVPAVGAVWTPNSHLKLDLLLPRPRLAVLIAESSQRQQWVYCGAGFSGGTWAYEQTGNIDDQLTYKDWRAVAGWELISAGQSKQAFGSGQKLGVELGYVFSRKIEFDRGRPDIELGNTWMVQGTVSF